MLAENDPDRVKKVYFGAITYAVRKGLPNEIAHDFASFVVIELLTYGYGKKYQFWFADFVEKEKGALGSLKSKAERVDLDTIKDKMCETDEADPLAESLVPKSIDGMIFILIHKYGFFKRDIAKMLGVSEQAIFAREKRAIKAIKSVLV